jgi:hypothetical protein
MTNNDADRFVWIASHLGELELGIQIAKMIYIDDKGLTKIILIDYSENDLNLNDDAEILRKLVDGAIEAG